MARAATRVWSESVGFAAARQETLVLLVSELVTNATLHSEGPADAPILLTVDLDGGVISGAVTDAGNGFTPGRRRVTDPGGFGLYLLARESLHWGVDRIGGTRVWFDL
jgi:anti-sigma regulatory factor (Ser/Thr protein kinase)